MWLIFHCRQERHGGLTESCKEPNVGGPGHHSMRTLRSQAAADKSLGRRKNHICPKCGEHFVVQLSGNRRAEKPRRTKRKTVSASAAAADIQHDTESGSPTRSVKMPLPGRTCRRQQTPIQAAKEKRHEAAEAADRPKHRVLNALSLLL